MDFLTGLYSNPNFGIILFTSISILVLAFLIILFFGKKDKTEAKQKETIENNNNANSQIAFQGVENISSVEVPTNLTDAVPRPMEMPINPVEPETLDNNINSSIEESNIPVPPKTDFDFDALAASISKELESIGINSADTYEPRANEYEEEQVENIQTPQEDIRIEDPAPSVNLYEAPRPEEPRVEMNYEKEPELETETKNTIPNVAQFSSVFVSNSEEEKENIIPEPVPVNPTMEMPKPIDLPKLNSDVAPKPEPIILENVSDNFFPGIEDNNSEQNRM